MIFFKALLNNKNTVTREYRNKIEANFTERKRKLTNERIDLELSKIIAEKEKAKLKQPDESIGWNENVNESIIDYNKRLVRKDKFKMILLIMVEFYLSYWFAALFFNEVPEKIIFALGIILVPAFGIYMSFKTFFNKNDHFLNDYTIHRYKNYRIVSGILALIISITTLWYLIETAKLRSDLLIKQLGISTENLIIPPESFSYASAIFVGALACLIGIMTFEIQKKSASVKNISKRLNEIKKKSLEILKYDKEIIRINNELNATETSKELEFNRKANKFCLMREKIKRLFPGWKFSDEYDRENRINELRNYSSQIVQSGNGLSQT